MRWTVCVLWIMMMYLAKQLSASITAEKLQKEGPKVTKRKKIFGILLACMGFYVNTTTMLLLPYQGGACLPKHITHGVHGDYTLWGGSLIPRRITSFCLPGEGPTAVWYSPGTEFV